MMAYGGVGMSKEKSLRTSRALACLGAVVGAGFASGREMTLFFSQYGHWSWALIAVSAAAMTALCTLLLGRSSAACLSGWQALYCQKPRWLSTAGQGCLMLLLCVTGGAMISAGGELIALTLPIGSAYLVGVIITLGLAAVLSIKSLKPLAWVSLLLIGMLVICYLLICSDDVSHDFTVITLPTSTLAKAFLFALAYAGLNMAIAIGVVCECGDLTKRGLCRMPVLFGLMMLMLMFLCNAMYLRHPQVMDQSMPMIALLRNLGKLGYYLGAALMYLAVVSTLIAILRSLRAQFSSWLKPPIAWTLSLLTPLCLSIVGFSNIISSLYPWLGLLCLIVMLLPLLYRRSV